MKRIYGFLSKIIKRIIAMLTPSCVTVGYKISRSIDGETSFLDNLIIRLHTFGCIFCERYRRQLIHIHEKLQKIQSDIPSDDLPALGKAAHEKLKNILRNADRP